MTTDNEFGSAWSVGIFQIESWMKNIIRIVVHIDRATYTCKYSSVLRQVEDKSIHSTVYQYDAATLHCCISEQYQVPTSLDASWQGRDWSQPSSGYRGVASVELRPWDIYSGTPIWRYAKGAVKLYRYIGVSLYRNSRYNDMAVK